MLRDGGATRSIRCAIYTRTSSEEGLAQDFNSLDAQREACAAYVMSQRHEGWTLIDDPYDDGGYSGGSMARLGLIQLLIDVRSKKIDVIIVYKIDRLTRSLADFAKMVEVLDEANASFVSITQSFNTTTSMGRLTLNVLLSFAQFEREVTGERIRDKIAASKKKGIWMGGTVPLGYDIKDRKLVINDGQAATVVRIFDRYLALGSIDAVRHDLNREGITTKVTQLTNGRTRGGVAFGRGGIAHVLHNRVYVGDIIHKGEHYSGEHPPIIDPDIWQRVQEQLKRGTVERRHGTRAIQPSLLSGLMFDHEGRALSPSHAVKDGKRYRYYVTHPAKLMPDGPTAMRLPAHDLEHVVIDRLAAFLKDASAIAVAVGQNIDADGLKALLSKAALTAKALRDEPYARARPLLLEWIERIDLAEDRIRMTVKVTEATTHIIDAGMAKVRRGSDVRLVIADAATLVSKRDAQLVALIADAHTVRAVMIANPHSSIEKLASDAGIGFARFKRLLRLSYLAPDIVEAILAGSQPGELTSVLLKTITNIPQCWQAQRAMLGFA